MGGWGISGVKDTEIAAFCVSPIFVRTEIQLIRNNALS